MNLPAFLDTPFQLRLTFEEPVAELKKTAAGNDPYKAGAAQRLLADIEPYPEIWEGITSVEQLEQHAGLIKQLLANIFPEALTLNEIKAASIPYLKILFNHTERFKNILQAAGPNFEINIRDFDEHQSYVFSCCIILNYFYGTHLDFSRPLFYDIPTGSGIMRHYRILYNADFMHIEPTAKAIKLTVADIDQLLNHYDDLALWKSKFPKDSYVLKGFAIMNLVDITVDNAVSTLKGKLLNPSKVPTLQDDFEQIFRSIFAIPDLHIGFTAYDNNESRFRPASFAQKANSYITGGVSGAVEQHEILNDTSFTGLVDKERYFAVSDTAQFLVEHPNSRLAQHLLAQEVRSFILAPLMKGDTLLGVLEVVSNRTRELNSVNAHKLEVVMPFITDTIDRRITDYQNQIQAVIQDEYTSLHPSVQWKFREEARKFIQQRALGNEYMLKEIVFENVYPLYGQVDIKASSETRNLSIQKDLANELSALIAILHRLHSDDNDLAELIERAEGYAVWVSDLSSPIKTDREQQIQYFIETQVHSLLRKLQHEDKHVAKDIALYFEQLDKAAGELFQYRRMYDTSVSIINQKMATLLDHRQADAQEIFPHYYERFKTDGVEHNLYVGASIAPKRKFTMAHFYQLRLWELQVLCEMERKHHYIKSSLPLPLDVTTLILAFSAPLSIRFRMDEKRFDVDGTYNARFEMVKKRIDKANIKGTPERVVEVGKIAIVYTSDADEEQYRGYIEQLQQAGILNNDVEVLEVEDLPGVAGLRALRCSIMH